MTREEEDEKDFEKCFDKGMYYLKFTLADPKVPIEKQVKGWMKELFLEGRRTLREKSAKQIINSLHPINTTGVQGSGPI